MHQLTQVLGHEPTLADEGNQIQARWPLANQIKDVRATEHRAGGNDLAPVLLVSICSEAEEPELLRQLESERGSPLAVMYEVAFQAKKGAEVPWVPSSRAGDEVAGRMVLVSN